jgi:hypothetical protein
MKQSSLNFCPVPLEQQPLNEYQALRESWFFRWVTFPKFKYARKLALVWVMSLFITAPIAAASFPPQEATMGFILASVLGSSLFVGVALLRLYLGWSYIGDRLNKEKIIYEESGWYDGQEWQKPVTVLMRDRLIFSYQVKPMLKRLQKKWFNLLRVN